MINYEHNVTFLTLSILMFFFCGLAVLFWGKKLPGKGSWLVWTGITLFLTGVGLDTGIFFKEEFKIKIWKAGWIWSRDEIGAITVGVLQDPLGLVMGTLSVFVTSALLMNHSFFSREPRSDKVYAAMAISTAGVALSWNALTPWLVFVGLLVVLFGGFVSLGSRSDSNTDAVVAIRFMWERSSGLILALFGTGILATTRFALLLDQPSIRAGQEGNLDSTWVGSSLLVLGLFVQMQPFPLLGWSVYDSELTPPMRTLLSQIFPAWASFSLFVRLEPHLRSLGLFPVFGWFALASCVLSVFSGLFQKHLRLGLGVWLNSGFSLSCALLAFNGPLTGLGMLLGVSLSALCLSIAAMDLFDECVMSVSNRKRAVWVKVMAFVGTAAGTGVFGFVSAGSGLRWIMEGMNVPGAVPLFLFTFAFFILLGWKLAWNVIKLKNATEASWLSIFSLLLLVLMSLGIVWNGTVSGNIMLDNGDQVVPSLFGLFFGAKSSEFTSPADYISASSLYWGALFLAFLLAYWLSGRKEDRWVVLAGLIPRTSRFLARGYEIDKVVERIGSGVIWLGRSTERLVDTKIWSEWIPSRSFQLVRTISQVMNGIDFSLSTGLMEGLRKLVEVPAKILQLIQTGDLRWYLVFALGSGFALLSHFLKI